MFHMKQKPAKQIPVAFEQAFENALRDYPKKSSDDELVRSELKLMFMRGYNAGLEHARVINANAGGL